MKRNILSVVGIIALIIIVMAMGGFWGDRTGTVKIGVALPLSGPAAFLGESAQDAAMLAIEHAGETNYDYELVIEDDGFDPAKTATVVNKFIAVDGVSAMITFGSGTANAAKPLAESNEVAHFALASDPTVAEGEYNFVHWTPAFTEGELLADEIVRRGYKTVSIVDTQHPGTLAVTKAVTESLKNTDVEIVSYDLTNVGETDFRTIAQKIKAINPDLIILEQFSPEIEITKRQLNELGVDIPVTSVEAIEWSSNPELFEGMWFVSDSKIDDDFKNEFIERFGYEPKPGSTYVYDLVTLIVNTQEHERNLLTQQEFAQKIGKMGTYDSPIFGTVPINEDGFFITDASVKRIEDGKVVYVD